jgi:hypothetical protein
MLTADLKKVSSRMENFIEVKENANLKMEESRFKILKMVSSPKSRPLSIPTVKKKKGKNGMI